jgi:aryl-phospho-beta-D-glucosidase BglC (GH1 family)
MKLIPMSPRTHTGTPQAVLRFISAAMAAGVAFCCPVGWTAPVETNATSNDHVWLRVKGKHLVTSPRSKEGEQYFIPAGIGYCRNVIFGNASLDDAVAKYCREHGLNTIRLAFYTRRFNNEAKKPIDIDKHIAEQIDPVVAAAKSHGLYVILDAHEYFHGGVIESEARQAQKNGPWNEQAIQEWIAAWVRVATKYKDEPYVLGYELLNEPHDLPVATVQQYYTRCLKAIRAVDQRHIILVGTAEWSHARALEATWGPTARTLDAPFNNVVFAFHDYPKDNDPPQVRDWVLKFRDTYHVPVMCTEFGATYWNHSETDCRDFVSGMLSLFAKENIGWMIWALNGLTDNPTQPTITKGKRVKAVDSCPYTDIWTPVAKKMASPFPQPK